MIDKVGIDIVQIKRIKLKANFISKVLHTDEILIFNQFTNKIQKRQFLAGRWAVKEAIFKASFSPLTFASINVFYLDNKPTVNIANFTKVITISIAHEVDYAVAIAIIEN